MLALGFVRKALPVEFYQWSSICGAVSVDFGQVVTSVSTSHFSFSLNILQFNILLPHKILSLSPVNGNSENLQQRLMPPKSEDNEQFIKSSQLVDQFNQNAKYIDQYPDVSIWRTLFVANEYCELSAYRRVSTSYHLFILLIILQVRAPV